MFIVDNEAKDGLAQFLRVVEFLFGDGNIVAIRDVSVTMGVNSNEQVAFFHLIQTRLGGFHWTRAEGFHPDDVQAKLLQGIMRGTTMFDQVIVSGAEKDFHFALACWVVGYVHSTTKTYLPENLTADCHSNGGGCVFFTLFLDLRISRGYNTRNFSLV